MELGLGTSTMEAETLGEKIFTRALLKGIKAQGLSHIKEDNPLTKQQMRHLTASLVPLFLSAASSPNETLPKKAGDFIRTLPAKPPLEDPEEAKKCCPGLVGEGRRILEGIPPQVEENEEWLRGHKETLENFLDEIGEIRLAYFCSVGWGSLESNPREFVLGRKVRDWRETLQKKQLGLKEKDLILLYKYINDTIYRLESSRELEPEAKRIPFARGFTLKEIYQQYPGAKDVDWWKDWKEEIEEYLKEVHERKIR